MFSIRYRVALYLICIGVGVSIISVYLLFISRFQILSVLIGTSSCQNAVLPNSLDIDCKLDNFLPQPLHYHTPFSVKSDTVIRKYIDVPINSTPPPPDVNGYKLILFHTRNYGIDFIQPGPDFIQNGDFLYGNTTFQCPQKCKYSLNRTLGEEAHAIIFGILDDMYHTNPGEIRYPLKKRPDQIWIAYTIEAPLYHDANRLNELGQMFNWTLTYRLDSDVYLPYGYFLKLKTPLSLTDIKLPTKDILNTKKLAASLISNCGGLSERDRVINAMKQNIPIDNYGKCGKECPTGVECRAFLAENYKFILAFENSLCQDYITEKFFEALVVGIVPVTYGLGDYTEVAPPGSYINVLDFPNVTALTNYLKYLDEKDDKYLEYFHWKRFYKRGPQHFSNSLCFLCVKLWNAPQNMMQQITNFNDWWNHKRPVPLLQKSLANVTLGTQLLRESKKNCISPSDIFKRGFLN